MKFSIVIPTFNSEKHIKETLSSVFSQSFSDFEVIVDDNCSKDNTLAIVNEYKRDPRLKVFANKEDLNIPLGWNRAFSWAQGEYHLLLHSDNLLHPDYLTQASKVMDRFSSRIFYCECEYFENDDKNKIFKEPLDERVDVLAPSPKAVSFAFRNQRMIPTSCVAIHRECFKERIAFDPKFLWDPDIEFFSALFLKYGFTHSYAKLAAIRTHEGQAPAWKNACFSTQYRKLLTITHERAGSEKFHFLMQWASSNEDLTKKLIQFKKKMFVNYFIKWFFAEVELFGYSFIHFIRKKLTMISVLTSLFHSNKIKFRKINRFFVL